MWSSTRPWLTTPTDHPKWPPMPTTTTITPTPPFYDDHSNTPPPCTSILKDQQELWGKVMCPSGLLADEILTPSHVDALHTPEFKLASTKPPKAAVRIRSPAPYIKKPLKPARVNLSHEGSVDSSDNESVLSVSSEASKISKPAGEPGHPRRGSYNLETALGWSQKLYSKFKVSFFGMLYSPYSSN